MCTSPRAQLRSVYFRVLLRRPDKEILPPNTHVVNAIYSSTVKQHHRTAHVNQIIMGVIDAVIEQTTARYSDTMHRAFDELDRVRNYEELKPEVRLFASYCPQ